jgi:quercetin dioxygenase-like cupin family protein
VNRLGDETMIVGERHVVICPPNVPHWFPNAGAE